MRVLRTVALTIVALCVAGCAGEPSDSVEPRASVGPGAAASATSGERQEEIRVVFLGDSLTAGLGLPEEAAFPALVEHRLREEGLPVRVVNAGVSGDTSAGGLNRLDWLLRQRPDILFVSLGANDGLRGLEPEMTERNLRQIVERGRAAGVEVILAGMRLPPNYGAAYVDSFEEIFPRLARELDVAWVPFLLEGVAGRRRLNLPDGIHPNAEGHEIIAEVVLPVVRDAVTEAAG
mgnify:CR=1 FL=1